LKIKKNLEFNKKIKKGCHAEYKIHFFLNKSGYNSETTYFRTYVYKLFFLLLGSQITSRNIRRDFPGTLYISFAANGLKNTFIK